ncbi:hypothetical protein CAter282_0419 [Collimonas arenae]|uniref:Uncharacterized protein n=1 Tax=Collimonas arenae TaxID=279058 RepID=A0A127QEI3_9BURK|nr:hypothetical protein CAter10_0451 [Collimonas arenae]AMP08235.1 hypothetical protein CAter282_0419 [Collimonas arenae]
MTRTAPVIRDIGFVGVNISLILNIGALHGEYDGASVTKWRGIYVDTTGSFPYRPA